MHLWEVHGLLCAKKQSQPSTKAGFTCTRCRLAVLLKEMNSTLCVIEDIYMLRFRIVFSSTAVQKNGMYMTYPFPLDFLSACQDESVVLVAEKIGIASSLQV
ncbi:unnamed protein product [Symbiodinium sp. KB8]|nr:unnamed protein product [Symbiodinium sp. KB8]